ncbi:DUF4280 domain-containing protein [Clostridium sp. DJ247]|uniref:DUF4280 domain-containing protein n=1 Tax=Clostridium sp. DJ247 TaxID=2726188 RepID=UPI00162685B8|nr:DUF4280 domain-containing protein [Clostridium sp. DJ247]MBC2582569.1 DUF4280 domain-containing protein [Clostridium sp. DJ247]
MQEPQIVSGEGEEKSYVVAGAKLKCTCGSRKSKLRVPSSHGVYIKDKAQLNVMDYKPGVNITTFGICKSPKNPLVDTFESCKPILNMPWTNGKNEVLVENAPALLNTSTNKCIYDGTIIIEDDGQ